MSTLKKLKNKLKNHIEILEMEKTGAGNAVPHDGQKKIGKIKKIKKIKNK